MLRDVIRQSMLVFRREPGFALAVVATLALGIGANTALFALVEAVLLRPLPYEQADALVMLRHRDLRTGLTKPDVALGDYLDLRARQSAVESLAAFGGYQATFVGGGGARRVEGAAVTADALEALRTQPALGRLLTAADAVPGAPPVAMVSYDFWQTELGADAHATTRTIQLGPARTAVVGILPRGFRIPGMSVTDIVVAQSLPAAIPAQRRSGWVYALGRLRQGTTPERAAAEFTSLSRQFELEFPQQNAGSRYEVLTLRDALVGDTRRPLLLLIAAVGFVLLLACANVGNLMLARALGRQHELGVRLALGASRVRLAGHLVGEALGLALAGGAASLLVARVAAPALAALVPNAAMIPGLAGVGVNPAVLTFALAASVTAALLSGGIASLGLTRLTAGAPRERQSTMDPRARAAASALIVMQLALALVLMAGAALTLRSLANQLAVDPGFQPDGVLTVQVSLPAGRYDRDEARHAFYAQAFESLASAPGVDRVGAAMVTPLTGNNWTAPLNRADRPTPPGQRPPEVGWQMASRGYFESLRIPLRAGRLFEPSDATGPPVVILSQAAVDRHFAGEQALGRRINLGDMQAEIVGIVGNIRRASLTDDPRADLYFPFERVMSPETTLFIRTSGDPTAALPGVREALRRIEPLAVADRARTLSFIAAESAAVARLATWLLGGFAAIAMGLSAVGVYGVMSYRVRRRTRELGTRIALGATPAAIAWLVLRHAAGVVGLGLGLGVTAAMACGGALSSMLFGVTPRDLASMASAAAVLAGAGAVASYLPARRASRVNPVTALSSE